MLGSFAGIALARRKGKWTVLFLALVFLILVTPEIVDAIALLIWYVRLGGPFGPSMTIPAVSYGMLRLWVGHSLFATAVVTLIVRARLEGMEETLEEAAADLYATPWRRFRQITLPLMLPAVLAGALLAFSFSLDDTDHLVVRQRRRRFALAGVRVQRGAQRTQAGGRIRVDVVAAADARSRSRASRSSSAVAAGRVKRSSRR